VIKSGRKAKFPSNGEKTMNSPNGSNPLYGNYQQQFAATQLNQPNTSLSMQPSQQSPNNS